MRRACALDPSPGLSPKRRRARRRPLASLHPARRAQARVFGPVPGRTKDSARAWAELGTDDGLGLGLAIVSAIAHGAKLRAVTRAAGGLAVEVIFPLPAGDGRRAERQAEALV